MGRGGVRSISLDFSCFFQFYQVYFLWAPLHSVKSQQSSCFMKSWILYRLRSFQKYPHFEDFFVDQRWLNILYHISTPCLIIYDKYVQSLLKATIRWALYAEAITVVIFKRNLTIIILIRARSREWCAFQCDRNCQRKVPAQKLKKKHQKLYLFQRTDQYSAGQEISLKIAWVNNG